MPEVTARRHGMPISLIFAVLVIALPIVFSAQGAQGGRGGGGGGQRGGPGGGAPGAAQAGAGARGGAPVDVTGYWVSLVTEDWIERMAPDSPRSGAVGARGGRGGGGGGGAPQAVAAGGDPCRVYGAGGSMRMPGRLNITWADDNTLKIDMDSGTQTRLLHFGGNVPANTPKSLQGYSVATWEGGAGGGGGGRGGGGGGGGQRGGAPAVTRWGNLKVVTTNMTTGYLLTSRAAYTDNATLTESFIRHSEFGNDYLTVVATLDDAGGGGGRGGNNVVSSTFKKEPDGSKFKPTGCDIVK